jgi:hypothetical protein
MSGDFNKLEPVNDRVKTCNYRNSIAQHELTNGNRIQLTKCRRADDTLFDIIKPQHIQNIDKHKVGSKYAEKHIVFTNTRRIDINSQMMEADYQKKKAKARKDLTNIVLPTLE